MKTYRWEIRRLAFFFAIAEANAFSAYIMFAHDGQETLHNVFRWKLSQTLLAHARSLQNEDERMAQRVQTRAQNRPTVINVSL